MIRYDFLWKSDRDAGEMDGRKDRPCAVITMSKENPDGSRTVAVAPITHSPIRTEKGETGVKIPVQLARHLGLDDDQSFVKTHEFNTFRWDRGRIPFGVSRAKKDSFVFGKLHDSITRAAYDQAIENRSRGQLKGVDRDKLDERVDRRKAKSKPEPESGNDAPQ